MQEGKVADPHRVPVLTVSGDAQVAEKAGLWMSWIAKAVCDCMNTTTVSPFTTVERFCPLQLQTVSAGPPGQALFHCLPGTTL